MYRQALPLLATLGLGLGGLAACGSENTIVDSDPATTGTSSTAAQPSDSAPDGDSQLPGLSDGAIGTINISITHPEADVVEYTIGCLGDAFPVTPEVEGIVGDVACTRLGEADVLERLVSGAPADQVCTEIYGGPDEATITGEINGETIDTVIKRYNGCGIADWDELLAGVLPPALGVTS